MALRRVTCLALLCVLIAPFATPHPLGRAAPSDQPADQTGDNFEGDILLSDEQQKEMRKRTGMYLPTFIWPDRTVPYEIVSTDFSKCLSGYYYNRFSFLTYPTVPSLNSTRTDDRHHDGNAYYRTAHLRTVRPSNCHDCGLCAHCGWQLWLFIVCRTYSRCAGTAPTTKQRGDGMLHARYDCARANSRTRLLPHAERNRTRPVRGHPLAEHCTGPRG